MKTTHCNLCPFQPPRDGFVIPASRWLALAGLLFGVSTAQAATFALGTSNLLEGPAAGSDTIVLSVSPFTLNWTATANASWLHLSLSNQTYAGPTNVLFSFDANPGAARTGTITFASSTLTVTQAGSNYVAVGAPTTLASGLPFADGIASDSTGNIYVAIADLNKIDKWTASNDKVTTAVNSGLEYPVGVEVGSTGTIYIGDGGNIYDAVGANANILVASGSSVSFGVDNAGNLYFASNNTIQLWTASTGVVSTYASTGSSNPDSVAVDSAADTVYFSSGHTLQEWTAQNNTVTQLASSAFNFQSGLAVDGAGNVYSAAQDSYYDQFAVMKWTAANNTLTELVDSGEAQYFGVAVDGVGDVFFTDAYGGVLEEIPKAFVNPAPKSEGLAAGYDSLPAVVPTTVNLNAPFTPSSDSPWLVITGVTNGVVSFSFSQNLSPTRTGHISLFDQSIPVTQTGPSFALGASSLCEGPAAGADSVVLAVTPNIGTWTASVNTTWLHLSPAFESGVGGTNIILTFDANPGATRSGKLNVNGQALTITQAGVTYISANPLTTLVSSNLANPSGVAVDRQGNVYIANTASNMIEEWRVLSNSVIPLVTGLNNPSGVAVDGSGNVYVADSGNNAIEEWLAAGSNFITLVSGLNQPAGVAVDTSGNIYFADTGNNAVKEFNPAATNTIILASGLNSPSGVAVDAAGNVFIADTGNKVIERWSSANSNFTTLLSGFSLPSGVAVDGSGNVYIADSGDNTISQWSPASGNLAPLETTGLDAPFGIAVGTARNIYIADTGNHSIKEQPYAFLDPTSKLEPPRAGSDELSPVLPATMNLLPPFAPSVDQPWVTNLSLFDSTYVQFFFSSNTGLSRTAHLNLLSQSISITQSAADVGPPVFSPPSGTSLTNGSLISLSCATPGAVIYFTTNSSPATTNSAVYAAPIAFTGPGPLVIEALAIASQYTGTGSATAIYTFPQVATPLFSPSAGPITNGSAVSISCATPGAFVYYTLDGTTPTTNSTPYSVPLVINGGVTVSAYAVASGYIGSVVASVTYNQAQTSLLQFAPPQGPITNGTLISITTATPGAVIYYTLDGSTPSTNSPIYSAPVLFSNQFTLQAQAFASGYLPSGVQSSFFGLLDPITNVAVTTFAGGTTAGFLDGLGTAARFSRPQGICMDSHGNLFVADTDNNSIRQILPSGQVITYAGYGSITNSQSPTASNAVFSGPAGVCTDANDNLYVADGGNNNRICKIGVDGSFTVYAEVRPGYAAGFGQLIAGPSGNLYAGNWAAAYEILTNGSVEGLAGTSCACPGGWALSVGLGLDSATNLYAATGDIVWIIPPGGSPSLLAGGNPSQISDGPFLQAGFGGLSSAAVDAVGNIYVSDYVRIRKLSASGWVNTIAGDGVAGYNDGPGPVAQFDGTLPEYGLLFQMGICLDPMGNLYVADSGNNCIRKISFNTIALPSLQASLTTNLVTLTWPGWAGDFVLVSSSTLSNSNSWMPVTNGAAVLQGGVQYVWTNQISNSQSFYRLRKP